ncbi:MAG: cysteine hydrolase [Deltaproteobacteria bacterium]|nr:cysteine hydrolase [Deltaproteobacteria bacterium]
MSRLKKPALIVIDVQNYFFQKGFHAYIRSSQKIIKPINHLIKLFLNHNFETIFTKQVFPKNKSHPMRIWWRRLPKGNECDLYDKLLIPNKSIIINKESYSAFFSTNLDNVLSKKKIKRLFFCGVMTHLCVETSIRDAFMRGFECFLIEDATTSKDSAHHKASVLNLRHGFCRILNSEEVYEYL